MTHTTAPAAAATEPLASGNPTAAPTAKVPEPAALPQPIFTGSPQANANVRTDNLTGIPASPASTGSNGMRVGAARRQRITGLFKWEGRIQKVDGEMFTAEIEPMGHEGPPLVADFCVDLLNSDAETAEPGDVFYLTVRTVKDPHGHRHRTESIRMRRLGRWTVEEVRQLNENAAAEMEKLETLFG